MSLEILVLSLDSPQLFALGFLEVNQPLQEFILLSCKLFDFSPEQVLFGTAGLHFPLKDVVPFSKGFAVLSLLEELLT